MHTLVSGTETSVNLYSETMHQNSHLVVGMGKIDDVNTSGIGGDGSVLEIDNERIAHTGCPVITTTTSARCDRSGCRGDRGSGG